MQSACVRKKVSARVHCKKQRYVRNAPVCVFVCVRQRELVSGHFCYVTLQSVN